MASIRKQLGLDYLRGAEPEEKPRSKEEAAFFDDALISYGRPMLEALRAAGGTARLYTLIDQLQIPIEAALKVADYLDARGYLRVLERDLKGNHQLQVTPDGLKLLG